MWRLAVVLLMVCAACSNGTADTTQTPTTSAPTTTTTVPPTTTSSTTSSTTTSSTTTTTVPSGFRLVTTGQFTALVPDRWDDNPEFPGTGAGFREDHSDLALPPTTLDVFFEMQEAGFDLDAHVARVQSDLAAFVPNFRVLRSGEDDLDGARSVWFEYAEEFDGFSIVIREQVALRDDVLVTTTLISPVEFFEFDVGQFETFIESFQFT